MTVDAAEFIRRFLIQRCRPASSASATSAFWPTAIADRQARTLPPTAGGAHPGTSAPAPYPTRRQTAAPRLLSMRNRDHGPHRPPACVPLALHATGKHLLTEMNPRRFPPFLESAVTPATHARTASGQRPDAPRHSSSIAFPALPLKARPDLCPGGLSHGPSSSPTQTPRPPISFTPAFKPHKPHIPRGSVHRAVTSPLRPALCPLPRYPRAQS